MNTSDSQGEHNDGQALPNSGRLLGIDFGTVRVGVAICDEKQTIASPLETYVRRDAGQDAAYFQQLAAAEQIVGIVVGLPVHLSGDESEKSRQARSFGQLLSEITGLPVVWVDERYSTARAEELMLASGMTSKQRRARLDKVAAQAILAAYLEAGPTGIPGSYF